jgi:NAD(P)-dependent dehydrogenase (short-subunit alcohol dehydrogenase family)
MSRLEGKTAIVTGGTTGIGLATAQRLAAEGAHVFVTGRRKAELDAAVEKIGADAIGVQSDVSDLADLDRLYAVVRQQGRRVDVLFANAGGGSFASLEQVTEEHFDQTFDVNVRGLVFTVQKALPLLNDGASVILTSSTAATSGAETFGVYAASKAAVRFSPAPGPTNSRGAPSASTRSAPVPSTHPASPAWPLTRHRPNS